MTAIRKCHSSWDGHGPGNPILCRLLIEDPGFLASRSFALLKVLIFVRNVTTRQVRHSNSLNSLNSGSTYRVRHIGRRYPLARSRHACGTQDGSAQNRPYSVFNHVKGFVFRPCPDRFLLWCPARFAFPTKTCHLLHLLHHLTSQSSVSSGTFTEIPYPVLATRPTPGTMS